MTIRDSIYFKYRGEYSKHYGILNVQIGGMATDMYNEPFLPNRELNEVMVRGRVKPYHQDIQKEPLEFSLSFAFDNRFSERLIRRTARWLSPDYYQELIFSNNPSRIFYAMPVQQSEFIHNGLKQGYLNLTFRCNSAYSYGNVYVSHVYESDTNGKYINFKNNGDLNIYPEIVLEKVGSGDISIKNLSDGGKEMIFEDLEDEEVVYIDNEEEEIKTNIENKYRFDNHNDVFLKMLKGINKIKMQGEFKLKFRWQPILLQ